ncbi:arylsulfatase [Flammeovirga agarivorans]|uniref:Arylsulfatase n=1 Tax=Flammeovirga agarivorans TaxID=2726742 RepID=A0A7X8SPG6_9BACT|nr:arylsulfatase [Flammeovirga agarivorans]NLR93954.1 arylsulfatase [Flammeovirga agarivorans]
MNTNKKQLFLTCFVYLLFFCFGCAKQKASNEIEKKPNVIVIMTDDMAWGDISYNGNKNINTPRIDQLSKEGASLSNFYVQQVCSPTRAEFLTGRYSHKMGVYDTSEGAERMNVDETTIAEVFKAAGYKTGMYGKWHNGMQYPYHPNARGFEDFYGFCSGHWGNYFAPMLEDNGKIVKGNGFIVDDFTDHAMKFMEENKEEPFFIYLAINTPHTPLQAPHKNWNNFKDKPLKMFSETHKKKEKPQKTNAALAMVENIDYNVGRINDKLEALDIKDETIVIFFSDNGPAFYRWNGGMKGKKGRPDEGGVLSPFFIQWPNRIKGGEVVNQIASVTDLLPTLAEMCEIPYATNHKLDGMSLNGLLTKGESSKSLEDRIILNQFYNKISIRNQKFRLAFTGELYDIEKDRKQLVDVSDQFPDVKKELVAHQERYAKEIKEYNPSEDKRPFILGHPDAIFTQIPARDAKPHGNIKRSNRWPNCSFMQDWTSINDSITWDVSVPSKGKYNVKLYYTCPEGDEGSEFSLTIGESVLDGKIVEAWDPPLQGADKDLYPRIESYVKDFKTLDLGEINIEKGDFRMTLKATKIPNKKVMDFRMLLFERLDKKEDLSMTLK